MPNVENIVDFYRGKRLFITGASGFLGKVLVEKLLRSTEVDKIYVLLRPKKGQNAEERLKSILATNLFHFNEKTSTQFHKLEALAGDLSETRLGLSDESMEKVNQCHIVFHVAANVKFNCDIKESFKDNVHGTLELISICKQMPLLRSLVHVSTAYGNCHLTEVEEKIYNTNVEDLIAAHDYESLVNLPNTTEQIEGRPNSYVYSKAIAESFLRNEFEKTDRKFNVSIARPAIVSQMYEEPAAGWVDNINGAAGLSLAFYSGLLQTLTANYWCKAEGIPVDYCANAILAIGWRTGVSDLCTSGIPVYNLTTGELNPTLWGHVLDVGREAMEFKYPSMRTCRPMFAPNRSVAPPPHYVIQRFILHDLFAAVIDFICGLFGVKSNIRKLMQRMNSTIDAQKHFLLNNWTFHVENYLDLMDYFVDNNDKHMRKQFNFDVRHINWLKLIDRYVIGVRRYLLKETDDTIELAGPRYRKLVLAFKMVKYALIAYTLYCLPSIYAVFMLFIILICSF